MCHCWRREVGVQLRRVTRLKKRPRACSLTESEQVASDGVKWCLLTLAGLNAVCRGKRDGMGAAAGGSEGAIDRDCRVK